MSPYQNGVVDFPVGGTVAIVPEAAAEGAIKRVPGDETGRPDGEKKISGERLAFVSQTLSFVKSCRNENLSNTHVTESTVEPSRADARWRGYFSPPSGHAQISLRSSAVHLLLMVESNAVGRNEGDRGKSSERVRRRRRRRGSGEGLAGEVGGGGG
jgi:hypothetical protein